MNQAYKWVTLLSTGLLLQSFQVVYAQQVQWAKVFALQKRDHVSCITRDENFLYAAGETRRNAPGGSYTKVLLYKLDPIDGDTIFMKDLGFTGNAMSMSIDPFGNLRLNCEETSLVSWDVPVSISMTTGGFIFRKDTLWGLPTACTIGKDSSLIVVGYRGWTGHASGETSMYFQRIRVDGVVEPFIELNPGHPNCRANRVEQLPNGRYLISGYVGSRVASYEVNELGHDSVYHQWYQTPDFTNMNAGYAGRLGTNQWISGGYGSPSLVGVYDSLKNKIWMKKEVGVLAPPQGMKDTTVVFGYSSPNPPFNYFYRFKQDSTLKWFFNMRDSLTNRGLPGGVDFFSYVYFPDESAVFAGSYKDGGATDYDPFFMKVANVGTPVTTLIKPKRGPLANETLAPWPNPTGGTLYLKQHFDKAEIHIYNISGKEIGKYQIGFAQPIDISGYVSGVYLYRAVIDGRFYSGKVIKR